MNIDPYFGNHVGDNLTDHNDEEDDENQGYNWINNPIRRLFDNPKNRFHRTYLDDGFAVSDDEE